VPGGWAAVGSIAEREFAAWRTTDGVHWRLTQHASTAAGAFPSASVIVRRDADLVAAGSVDSAPAVWVSHDHGGSWSRVRSPAFGPSGYLADAAVVGDDVALVGARGESQPRSAAWVLRSDGTVVRAAVKGAVGAYDGMSALAVVGGALLAVGSTRQRPAAWRSSDDGVSWTPVGVAASGNGALRDVLPLREQLVASGDYWRAGGEVPAGYVWLADSTARSWRPVPRHTGSFGDGRLTQVLGLVAFRGAALMLGRAEDRANANFCYDELATCDQITPVLWLSADGRQWGRIAVPAVPRGYAFSAVATDPAGLLLLGTRFDPARLADDVRVWRWTGPAGSRPDAPVPPEERFATPRHPMIERYDAQLELGRTYRFVTPIGGPCGAGRLDFDSMRWKVTHAWGEAPYPKDWPVRHEDVADGPTDYLYGTVRAVDDRHIEVGLEDGTTLRRYEPTAERLLPCA
jgi:hypothetical protein